MAETNNHVNYTSQTTELRSGQESARSSEKKGGAKGNERDEEFAEGNKSSALMLPTEGEGRGRKIAPR